MKEKNKEVRLVAYVSKHNQYTIHKAASLSGVTVSQFLIDAVVEKARVVINDYEVIKLSDEAATKMMSVLNNPPEPNAYLKRAFTHYRDSVENDNDRDHN